MRCRSASPSARCAARRPRGRRSGTYSSAVCARWTSPGPKQTAGMPASTVSVAPSCQLSRPPSSWGCPRSRPASTSDPHDRIVGRDLGRRHAAHAPRDLGRVLAQPGVAGRRLGDPLPRTRARLRAIAVLVGSVGEVLDVALEHTRGRVGHEPFAARDDRRHAVSRGEIRMGGLLRPVLAQALDGGQHDVIFSIALTAPPCVGRERRDAGVPRAAVHGDARQQAAAAGHPHGEAARLGHDGGVGLQQTRGEQPARARRLLLGDRVDDQVAGERNAELGQDAGRHDHARDAALHVARRRGRRAGRRASTAAKGSASVQFARGSTSTTSTWPLSSSVRPPPLPRKRATSCGRPSNVSSSGTIGCGRSEARVRLVQLDLGAVGSQQRRQVLLQRALLSRRGARRVRDRVERHELARQRDEGLAARGHGVDDALLLGRDLHDAIP